MKLRNGARGPAPWGVLIALGVVIVLSLISATVIVGVHRNVEVQRNVAATLYRQRVHLFNSRAPLASVPDTAMLCRSWRLYGAARTTKTGADLALWAAIVSAPSPSALRDDLVTLYSARNTNDDTTRVQITSYINQEIKRTCGGRR